MTTKEKLKQIGRTLKKIQAELEKLKKKTAPRK